MTCKQVKSFMGGVYYVDRFILDLAELLEPFQKFLKKNMPFMWGEEQHVSFQKVKDILSSPLTMISPIKSLPLTIYLTSINKFVGALLVQEVEEVDQPVY